jgi:hypothetical protein
MYCEQQKNQLSKEEQSKRDWELAEEWHKAFCERLEKRSRT